MSTGVDISTLTGLPTDRTVAGTHQSPAGQHDMDQTYRFDTDALARAAGRMEELATELAAVATTALGAWERLGEGPPPEAVEVSRRGGHLGMVAMDLRLRVRAALHDPHVVARQDHWDRTWRLGQDLGHLDARALAGLLTRLPEADRHDSPIAALARMAATTSMTVVDLLRALAAVMDDLQPADLEGLGMLLRQPSLPTVPGTALLGPIETLVSAVEHAVIGGDLDPATAAVILTGLAGLITSVVSDGATTGELADVLDPETLTNGDLGVLLGLLPVSSAMVVLAALLTHARPVPLPGHTLVAIGALLDRVAASPDQFTDEDLAVLLQGLGRPDHRTSIPVLGDRLDAMLMAIVHRVLRPGFLESPTTGRGLLTSAALRRLLTNATGSMVSTTLLGTLMNTAIGLVAHGEDNDQVQGALKQLGRVVGLVLDTSEDAMEALLRGRQQFQAILEPLLAANLPAKLSGLAWDAAWGIATNGGVASTREETLKEAAYRLMHAIATLVGVEDLDTDDGLNAFFAGLGEADAGVV